MLSQFWVRVATAAACLTWLGVAVAVGSNTCWTATFVCLCLFFVCCSQSRAVAAGMALSSDRAPAVRVDDFLGALLAATATPETRSLDDCVQRCAREVRLVGGGGGRAV